MAPAPTRDLIRSAAAHRPPASQGRGPGQPYGEGLRRWRWLDQAESA